MRSNIVALQAQVEQLTDEQAKQRNRLKSGLSGLETRLNALEKKLLTALDRLQTNTADSGVNISELQREIAMLRGDLETFKHKLSKKKPTSGLPIASGGSRRSVAPSHDLRRILARASVQAGQ